MKMSAAVNIVFHNIIHENWYHLMLLVKLIDSTDFDRLFNRNHKFKFDMNMMPLRNSLLLNYVENHPSDLWKQPGLI